MFNEHRGRKKGKSNMNILYASDNHYADILGISILSLLENNRECDDIKVSIINDEISDENIRNIESIF